MSTKQKEFRKKSSISIPTKEEMMSDIKKQGYLKRLKTMKKKYFVLRTETPTGPARLEYYDNEKKWKAGIQPKRSIILKTCFNINRKLDSKQKNVIALYTRDDCFAVVTENDDELDQWLTAMLELQHGTLGLEGDTTPKPNFEHVWQVIVKNKGLGSSRNISGTHRLCLTAKSLSLVKVNPHSDKPESLEFPLMSIRRCGHSDCFFFMELGRSSVTGAGELWMQTEDTIIAQNMHEAILGAMKSSGSKEELGPLSRPRSASTSENSKPISSRHPVGSVIPPMASSIPLTSISRERCDSMPSRSRTVSEGHQDSSPHSRSHYSSASSSGHLLDTQRPHTMYGRTVSYSPPSNKPLSPSGVCSSSSSLSFDEVDNNLSEFHLSRFPHTLSGENTLHTEPTIKEEGTDSDYLVMAPGEENKTDSENYVPMTKYDHSSLFLNLTNTTDDFVTPIKYDITSDYLEMASPSTSSQPDNTEGYMTMSAVGSLTVDVPNSLSSKQTSLLSDSPSNSLDLPKGFDGYVPMAPVGVTIPTDLPLPKNINSNLKQEDGYLDMTPLSTSLPKTISQLPGSQYLEMSSPTLRGLDDNMNHSHLHSINTQEEFHLDKVKSYFSPSEDDSDDYIKPVRAYSIGSRPQLRKSHLATHLETSRVRAYSVGSQASTNTKKNVNSIESELGTLKNIDARASVKSSSAPLLPSGAQRHRTSSTKDYNEDLMEIDYNQSSSHSKSKVGNSHDNSDHTRRFTVSNTRQRSNSRSSSGTSPMSSLMELTEKPERNKNNENKDHEDNLPLKGFSSSKTGNSIEIVNIQKSGSISNTEENQLPHLISQTSESKNSHLNSGNNNSNLNSEAVSDSTQLSTSVPNPSGDYVNLDFNHTCSNIVMSTVLLSDKSHLQNNSNMPQLESNNSLKTSAMHDYINIHLGTSLSSKSDYTVMAPVQTSCERNSTSLSNTVQTCDLPTTKSNSQTPHSPSLMYGGTKSPSLSSGTSSGGQTPSPSARSPQSFLTFRKQFSAPTVPISVRADSPSPGRKSSYPITTPAKSAIVSAITVAKPVLASSINTATWLKNSYSSDASCVPTSSVNPREENNSDQSNLNILTAPTSPTSLKEKSSEAMYENVSIGSGSLPNSRPSSISSERELNYASLDLAPTVDDDKTPHSPRSFKLQQPTESYAEIDFTKSEGLRHTSGSLREGRV
ncbi:insulin receptor substrate 1 isoform X2 [Centruroides vittatus]|uniref:insulin receptor substrate 1 isoform X2 n=1 Tax=Centruroides vittatus TaxID=120091 RepID=UPI00350FA015